MLTSDWLSDSIMNGDWLYFAFFTSENIAHIEFYLQGLLPKTLAIYTIKSISGRLKTNVRELKRRSYVYEIVVTHLT